MLISALRATSVLLLALFSVLTWSTPTRLAPPLEKQMELPQQSNSAETLYSVTEATLFSDGQWQQSTYVSIRINNLDAARDYGRTSIRFNHYYSDMDLDFANSLSADNDLQELESDAIQRRVIGGGQDFYSDSSELVFSLPNVNPGTVIEFQYTRKSKTLPLPELYSSHAKPHWFQRVIGNDGWRGDYVHNHSYTLKHPKDLAIYNQPFAGYPSKAKITTEGDNKVRKWSMKNIPSTAAEDWSPDPNTYIPGMDISTHKDWSIIDKWTWEKVAPKLLPTDDLRKIVDSLNLPDNATTEDKIRAVYGYVAGNIRYVFAHLGRGGYEPHFPDEAIATKYGDCKDQTVLILSLLRMLGVEAYPALIETRRAGNHDTGLVGLIFDHMIVHIPAAQDASTQWLDAAGDRSLYPGISNYLIGQNVLISDGKGGKLTHLPNTGAINKAVLSLTYSMNKERQTFADVEVQLSGFFEQNMRNWWTVNNNREQGLKQYFEALFNNNLEYTVDGELTNSNNLFQPVQLKAKYTFAATDDKAPPVQAAGINQILDLFVDRTDLLSPGKRKNRYEERDSFELEMEVHFAGLPMSIPAVIQSADDVQTPYFSITQRGQTSDDSTYKLNMRYKQYPLDLSLDEYAAFYKHVQKIKKISPWAVSMQTDLAQVNNQQLEETEKQFGKNSFEHQLALAKKLLDEGKFSEALKPAGEAVKLNKNNGEAWYVLATAQGFNTMIEESSTSYEKAESLGYLP